MKMEALGSLSLAHSSIRSSPQNVSGPNFSLPSAPRGSTLEFSSLGRSNRDLR